MPLFSNCWLEKQFLLKNGSYVYGESEFTVDDSFQKKKLLEFVNCLGYIGGVVPSNEAEKKHWKRLIDVSLLMGSCSCEGRRTAFSVIENEVIVWVLKRGIQPHSHGVNLLSLSEPSRNVVLPGTHASPDSLHNPSHDRRNSPFDDDWAFFVGLS